MTDQRKFICLYRHIKDKNLCVLSLKDSVLSCTIENLPVMKTMIEKLQEDGIIGDASIITITVYDFIAADLEKRVEVEQRLMEIARSSNEDESYLLNAIAKEANLNPQMLN